MKSWNQVTVFQWQQLTDLFTSGSDDTKTPMIAILTGMTETEVDSLPWKDREALYRQFAFVNQTPNGEPVRFIKVGKKRYRCIYDIKNMPGARYIETKHFSADPNGSLHKIAASMVMPQKRTIWGWRDDKYDASKHTEYAEDMLQAPITAVLGSVVFFCNVYKESIKSLRGFLIAQMERVMTTQEAKETLQALESLLDGITQLRLSPNTNGSR